MKTKILFEKPKNCEIVHFHMKHKYYDMILSGEKKEEYREIKPYYNNIFRNLTFLDKVYGCFWKGYTQEHFFCEIKNISYGFPLKKWSDPKTIAQKISYVLHLNN